MSELKGAPRWVVNTFIVCCILLALIDGLPSTGRLHSSLKGAIDPLLDVTGTWQGSWMLFAPNPDKVNVRVSAVITYEDGFRFKWRSDEWQNMGVVQRFIDFREMEYVDGIRLDGNQAAWSHFARYLSKNLKRPDNSTANPVKVELVRHWAKIPSPSEMQYPAKPYVDFHNSYQFYKWAASDE